MTPKKKNSIDAEGLLKRTAALVGALPEASVERTNEHAAFIVVEQRLTDSYRRVAPKRLVKARPSSKGVSAT